MNKFGDDVPQKIAETLIDADECDFIRNLAVLLHNLVTVLETLAEENEGLDIDFDSQHSTNKQTAYVDPQEE
jgi:hypothetical protein